MWSKLTKSPGNKVQNFTDLHTAPSEAPTCTSPTPSSPRICLSPPPWQPRKGGDLGGRPHSSSSAPSKADEDPPLRRLKKHRLRFPTAGDLRNFSVLRKKVAPTKVTADQEILSEEELLQNIRGENGRWKQKKAEEVWMDYLALKEEEKHARQTELQRQKQLKQEELEREARMQAELIEHRKAEAKKRKRLEEERQRQKEKEEEKERLRKAEEERLWRARQPRPCEACSGSGECKECHGKGCFHALYLSHSVTKRSVQFHGRTVTGCTKCGGQPQLEKDQVKVRKGSGKCPECKGTGMITPSPGDQSPQAQGTTTSKSSVGHIGSKRGSKVGALL